MFRSRPLRVLLVIVLLAPLVLLQGLPVLTPAWLQQDLAGVPLTACAVGLWFVLMMLLAWLYSDGSEPRSGSRGAAQ